MFKKKFFWRVLYVNSYTNEGTRMLVEAVPRKPQTLSLAGCHSTSSRTPYRGTSRREPLACVQPPSTPPPPPLKRGWTSFREYRKLPFKAPNFKAPPPPPVKSLSTSKQKIHLITSSPLTLIFMYRNEFDLLWRFAVLLEALFKTSKCKRIMIVFTIL